MRRIIYFLAASLDGFLARSNGEIDWLFTDQDYGFLEFFDGIDTVLMGRKTYEQALTFPEYPYPNKENFIFTRSKRAFEYGTAVHQPISEFTAVLKTKAGKDIWLVGGGDLAGGFFSARAVDRLVVYIHPILLGKGLQLAQGLPEDVFLNFEGSETFNTGLVKVSYSVQKESQTFNV